MSLQANNCTQQKDTHCHRHHQNPSPESNKTESAADRQPSCLGRGPFSAAVWSGSPPFQLFLWKYLIASRRPDSPKYS